MASRKRTVRARHASLLRHLGGRRGADGRPTPTRVQPITAVPCRGRACPTRPVRRACPSRAARLGGTGTRRRAIRRGRARHAAPLHGLDGRRRLPADRPATPIGHRHPCRGRACPTPTSHARVPRPARQGRGTAPVPTQSCVDGCGMRVPPRPRPPLPRGAGEGVPSGARRG